MKDQRLRARIRGRVQGVGFRDFARFEARQRNLTGYALNLPNGDVEVVAEGDKDMLEIFLNALRKGPPAARVLDIDSEWSDSLEAFQAFTIRF